MQSRFLAQSRRSSLLDNFSLKLSDSVLRSRTRNAEQNARLEAEIATRVKTEFISNMSHELRTPLNTVIGFSKLLAENDRRRLKDEDVTEYAKLINDAAAHLLSLINDILDISKLHSGRYTIEVHELSLDELLETILRSQRKIAKGAGVTIEEKFDDLNSMVRGDAQKLTQAISNVLNNAIKFTAEGGKVFIESKPLDDGGSGIFIRDTGVGMSEEQIAVALAPFGQVDGGRSRWREGAGLGLPIAKALIELHGGRMDIRSAKSIGTEVGIYLPSPDRVELVNNRKSTQQQSS